MPRERDAADDDVRPLPLSRRQATAVFEAMVMLQHYMTARKRDAAKLPYGFDDADAVKQAVRDVFGKGIER